MPGSIENLRIEGFEICGLEMRWARIAVFMYSEGKLSGDAQWLKVPHEVVTDNKVQ